MKQSKLYLKTDATLWRVFNFMCDISNVKREDVLASFLEREASRGVSTR